MVSCRVRGPWNTPGCTGGWPPRRFVFQRVSRHAARVSISEASNRLHGHGPPQGALEAGHLLGSRAHVRLARGLRAPSRGAASPRRIARLPDSIRADWAFTLAPAQGNSSFKALRPDGTQSHRRARCARGQFEHPVRGLSHSGICPPGVHRRSPSRPASLRPHAARHSRARPHAAFRRHSGLPGLEVPVRSATLSGPPPGLPAAGPVRL